MPAQSTKAVEEKARLLSLYSMMATTAAGSGHPTSCMSAAELVAGVFFQAMNFDPEHANSNENDRFVLSKGHAPLLLISTEFSCASRTLMDEMGYDPGDRRRGRFHFLVIDPGTEFDRTGPGVPWIIATAEPL